MRGEGVTEVMNTEDSVMTISSISVVRAWPVPRALLST